MSRNSLGMVGRQRRDKEPVFPDQRKKVKGPRSLLIFSVIGICKGAWILVGAFAALVTLLVPELFINFMSRGNVALETILRKSAEFQNQYIYLLLVILSVQIGVGFWLLSSSLGVIKQHRGSAEKLAYAMLAYALLMLTNIVWGFTGQASINSEVLTHLSQLDVRLRDQYAASIRFSFRFSLVFWSTMALVGLLGWRMLSRKKIRIWCQDHFVK